MNDQSPARVTLPPEARAKPRRSLLRRLFGRLLWLLFFAAVLAGLAYVVLSPRAPAPPSGGRFAGAGTQPVVTAAAKRQDVPVYDAELGTVTPLAMVTVRTQINGPLTQVAFTEGQPVKKGDFLAEVDPRPYQHTLDQLTGQLQRDTALLTNARLDLARFKKLAAQDSIARQQVDTQDSLVHQLEGTVKSDQSQVDNANLNLSYCHIVSPINGRAGLRLVDPGNYVQVSDANGLVVVTQTKPISVIFAVPEDDLPAIRKRFASGAKMPAVAYDRGHTTKLAEGTLTTIDNQIDTSTGTVKLRAEFANDDESLFPNQFVNVELLVDTHANATVVPTAAIQRGAPGTFVYLLKPDSTVTVRPVALGPAAGQVTEITKGLTPGDQVVVEGADKLREGAKVAVSAPAGDTPRTGKGQAGQGQAGQGEPGGQKGQGKKKADAAAAGQ